jgi:hypothetical protein
MYLPGETYNCRKVKISGQAGAGIRVDWAESIEFRRARLVRQLLLPLFFYRVHVVVSNTQYFICTFLFAGIGYAAYG